ncbi:4-hydroxyphenylacetate 3-hydroxylase family protein [Leptospira santarosai]|uniref:4-hydroxyphenylacetate 3-hydroxylase family protein n=1 Tax=Leptospira santarosai TaxID=28183 RepID=UPI00031833FA|nr:4-hydroxyphenylacetate 3-hydroxylase N-terminal domain-containing protein [Leptospira santarosai]
MRLGSEYKNSLADDRHIVCLGEKIDNVSEHPFFKGCVQTIAQLIDMHNDGDYEDLISYDENRKIFYPTSYLIPKTKEDLIKKGKAFRIVANATGGLMARTPDFLAALLAAWSSAANAFGYRNKNYATNIQTYYEYCKEKNLTHSHAISDPPPDRFMDISPKEKVSLRKIDETDKGIIVSGIKMLATLAPISDELIIYPFRVLQENEADHALAFAIPVNTPGLKFICRPPLAFGGSEFDHPLKERFDEMDALCVFENAFIPNERIFLNGDVTFANEMRLRTGMVPHVSHQISCRVAVKAQFILGLASLIAKSSARDKHTTVQEMLGELSSYYEVLRSLLITAETEAEKDLFGNFIPATSSMGASSTLAAGLYKRSIDILQLIGASGIIMHPSESDIISADYPDIWKYFDPNKSEALAHIQLLKIASDLASDSFGGRQVLYETFYIGAPQAVKIRFYNGYNKLKEAEKLAETFTIPLKVPDLQI